MTGESTSGSLGTARIDVTVNADTMAPGIAKARTAVAGMGTEAEAQYAKAAASSKKYADSLIRQADLIGKTRAEQIAYNAQTRIGGELGAQIAARALAQQNALTGAAGAAKALSSEINSISDAQLLKVNQAIAAFRQNAAAGRAAASAAAAENADRASADAYLAADREKIAANAGVIESNDAVAASAAARAAEEAAIQAESVAQLNAATLAKSAAYARLQLAMQGNLATESGIAEAEFAIDEAMAAGAITVREQAAYFVKLAAAENLATVETEANTAATLENAAAFKLSSRATTELGVVFGELASGNTGRLKYSLSALANQTGLLAKLMSPAGLAIIGVVGAIALFAKAAYEGEQETTAFNKALESTGGYAGVTTEELQSMAKAMSGTIGTQHEAAAALAEVAGTGKFTAGQIALVGKAAEEMSRLTGQSTAATIKQFESLQEKPLEAVLKLNDAQHFLTLSIYDQIKALDESGKTQEAAALAEQTYAASLDARTQSVQNDMGLMQEAWAGVTGAAKAAWDAMLDVGRPQSGQDKFDALAARRDRLLKSQASGVKFDLNSGQDIQVMIDALTKKMAAMQDALVASEKAASAKANAAQLVQDKADADRAAAAYANNEEKRVAAYTKAKNEGDARIARANAAGNKQLAAELLADEQKQLAGINAKYGAKKSGHVGHASSADPFASLNSMVQRAQVKDNTFGVAGNATQQVTDILAIVDAGAKLIASGHDVAKVQATVATGVAALNELYTKQADQLHAKNIVATEAYADAMDKSNAALQLQVNSEIARIGMGEKEYRQQQEINQAYQEQADKLEQVALKQKEFASTAGRSGLSAADAKDLTAVIQSETDKRVKIIIDGNRKIDAAQADWLNGAKKAFQDWADDGARVAEKTQSLFTNTFGSLNDAIANFVTTGKLNFNSLFDSFLSGLIKLELQAQESKLFGALGLAGGQSSGAGGGGSTMGSIFDLFSSFSANAKGGVYNSPSLASYSGQMVDKPTMFAFAKGAGLMGEAGPEAILPLKRDANGKLGVTVQGGTSRNVSVNQTIVVQGTINRRTADQMAQQTAQKQRVALARNS